MRKKVLAIIVWISVLFLAVITNSDLSTYTCNISANTISGEQFSRKTALLRLEDICPGGLYISQENLDKLNVVAAYLQQEGIPFEVSLIPRMIEPDKNYDVTIADNTEYTRRFVSTMKNLEEKGGVIGIHGYTHQSGNSNSVSGYEFYNESHNPDVPNTYEYAKERFEKAVDLFNKAGINPAYWETPHYAASDQQLMAFEEQIGLIYENNYYYYAEARLSNKVINHNKQYHSGVDIVPAPLGHLNSQERLASMMDSLDTGEKDGLLASLYFHPTREFPYIQKAYDNNGEVYYVYDEKSLLHQLVKKLKDRGYTFVSIYSLVGFVPAQRYENIPFNEGDEVFTGLFVPGAAGKSLLIWNKKAKEWHMFRYTASWYAPRKANAFEDLGVWLKDLSLDKDTVSVVGYFKNKDKEDLLLLNVVSGSLILAENNGGKFIPKNQKWQALSGLQTVQPLAGELNGDGLTDLFLYDRDKGRIGTAINKGGLFKDIAWQSFGLLKAKDLKLIAGDFNGDDISDILVIDFGTDKLWMLIGGKADCFSLSPEPWNSQFSFGKEFRTFAADINGDNKDDLMYYSPNGFWKSFISDGDKFVSSVSFGPWGSRSENFSLAADISGDKRADLVMIDNNASRNYNLNTAISVLGRKESTTIEK